MSFVKKATLHEPATNVEREREIFHKVEAIRVDPNLRFPNIAIEGVHCGRHLSSETATSSVLMQKAEETQAQAGVEEKGGITVSGPLLYQLLQRFPRLRRFLRGD